MDTIQSVLATAVTAEVYRFEGLYDLLLKRTGQIALMGTLTANQVPMNFALYRVQKSVDPGQPLGAHAQETRTNLQVV